MREIHQRHAQSMSPVDWMRMTVAAVLALVVGMALLPASAQAQESGQVEAAQAVAPELAEVTVSKNLPVAPVDLDTADIAPGRNAANIAVNPEDPDHYVATDWDAHADPGLTCEVHTSFDAGATWSTANFEPPPGFGGGPPDVAEGERGFCSQERGSTRHSMHGEAAFGADGVVYVPFVSIRDGRLGTSLLVARSEDGGLTFDEPIEAIEGGTTEPVPEHPSFQFPRVAVDPGAGEGGADILYMQGRGSVLNPDGTVSLSNVAMTVSDDGGQTWSTPVAVNRADQTLEDNPFDFGANLQGQVVIDSEGTAYTVWHAGRIAAGPPAVNTHRIRIGWTEDEGATWQASDVLELGTPNTYPRLAINPNNDDLHLVYAQEPQAISAAAQDVGPQDHWFHPEAGMYAIRSTDGGQTWSTPVKVDDGVPPDSGVTLHQRRHPNVGVSPSGRVDVVWMDRRHWIEGRTPESEGGFNRAAGRYRCEDSHWSCSDARTSDIYHAFSDDGGQSFSTDVRLTDYSSNDDQGWEFQQGAFWHHGMGLDHAGDDLVAVWTDSRRGKALPGNYAFSFAATADRAFRAAEAEDLFFTRVRYDDDPDALPAVESLPADNAPDLSVTLSQEVGYPGGVQGRGTGKSSAIMNTSPVSRVVLVNEDDWASALVGSVLARRHLGPVLATPAGGLPGSVSAEINRMEVYRREEAPDPVPDGTDTSDMVDSAGHTGVTILGGTDDVSGAIQTDIAARGPDGTDVVRLAQGHVEMAVAVALSLDHRFDHEKNPADPTFVPAFDAVVVVNPTDEDSAGVAVLAAARRLPVLFTNADGSLPAATSNAIDTLDITDTVVVGDETAVTPAAFAALPGAERVTGDDVFDTSAAIVEESYDRALPANIVYVVGDDPMHAALAGSPVARAGGMLVQAPDARPQEAMATMEAAGLAEHVDRIVRFGADVAAPTWPGDAQLTASEVTQTSVVLTWPAATDDTDVAGYRVYQDGVEIADQAGTTLTVTGLDPDTDYEFRVEAYDAEGNESDDGPTTTVTTSSDAEDTAAPSWPTGATLSTSNITHNSVVLSWVAASDDTDVAGYRVYQDGVEIADQTGRTLAVTGLDPDTDYEFRVEAYDAAGNESDDGPSATVTTLEGPDGSGSACDPALVPDSPFTDIAGNTHEANIECIVWFGITQGTTPTTYSPANPVRRDQMASFIARLMEASGVTLPAASDQGFTDIAGNVHAARINQLAELGVVLGTSPTTYAPSQEVRRDQMASFLVRAYEHIDDATLARNPSPFTDVAGNVHLANIEKVATAGFTQGTTPTTYSPAASVRRDQMGSFLARVLNRGMTDGHVTHPS